MTIIIQLSNLARISIIVLLLVIIVYPSQQQQDSKTIVSGTGSSLQKSLMNSIGKKFSDDKTHPYIFTYSETNSYTPLQYPKNNENVFFATDLPSQFSTQNNLFCFANTFSSILIIYNIPNTTRLELSKNTLLRIFKRNIVQWSDNNIASVNPDLSNVDQSIEVVYRTDYSGTSLLMTYLLDNQNYGYRFSDVMNINTPLFIDSNDQLFRYVNLKPYTIGYIASSSFISGKNVKIASIDNMQWDGSTNMLTNVIDKWAQRYFPSSSSASLPDYSVMGLMNDFNSREEIVYPFIGMSHSCIKKTQNDTITAIGVLKYIYSMLDTQNNEKYYDYLHYYPIPSQLSSYYISTIQQSIMCDNGAQPCQNYYDKFFTNRSNAWVYIISIMALIVLFIMLTCFCVCAFIFLIGYFSYRESKNRKLRNDEINQPMLDDYKMLEKININQHQIIGDDDLMLEEIIGSGSFAQVYKGKWLGAIVAIKKMKIQDLEQSHSNSSDTSTSLEDFIKECSLMSQLKHPNILQFLGTTVKAPFVYLITEYCAKGSFQSIIRNKQIKLSLRRTISMMLDAAKGMYYLHSHNPPIIHRDFKSANLLVDENWRVKVADFGMSTKLVKGKDLTICGTPETAAPEVLARSTYTEKADVYSFGIVLWEVLTREILYPGLNFYELSVKVVNEGFRPSLDDYDFPQTLRQLMSSCWNAQPNDRPNFSDIVNVLEEYYMKLLQKELISKTNTATTASSSSINLATVTTTTTDPFGKPIKK